MNAHFPIENALQSNQSIFSKMMNTFTIHFPFENFLQSKWNLIWNEVKWGESESLRWRLLSGSTWIFFVYKLGLGPVLLGLSWRQICAGFAPNLRRICTGFAPDLRLLTVPSTSLLLSGAIYRAKISLDLWILFSSHNSTLWSRWSGPPYEAQAYISLFVKQ